MTTVGRNETENQGKPKLLRIRLLERGPRRTVVGRRRQYRHVVDFSHEHPDALRQAQRRAWQFWRR